MAKKRKTREQKKLADQRHNFTHSLANHSHSEAKISLQNKENVKPLIKPHAVVSINEYPYLIKDLSKTGLLTAAIITSQLILFFLLKNHIFTIPGLIY
jgi:hypothetical protein